MRFIGDVHGHIGDYLRLRGDGPSFQVGDMGVGFPGRLLPEGDLCHRFIRGNHDDPAACREHPNYAGDYDYDRERGMFYLGGAFSIDYAWRQARMRVDPTPIWWPDEELSDAELTKALALYDSVKPRIVVTHDCPESVSRHILEKMVVGFRPEKKVPTRTGKALQRMLERHQPEIWLFGHYHIDLAVELGGTMFRCLGELSVFDLP